jgi:flagellar motor switch protein FliG
MSQLPTAIRKAAVLVGALDDRSAEALLNQMGPEMAAKVRSALVELDDIAADEQQAVIAEFLRGGSREDCQTDISEGVELDESLLRRIEQPAGETAGRANPPATDCFEFLRRISSRHIAQVMRREQPQTIAVVVSRLDAAQAAQLLEALPSDLATDVLEKMAWLVEPSTEVLADLEQQLRRDLAPYSRGGAARTQSLSNLSTVLGAMDAASRSRVLERLAERDQALSRKLGFEQPTGGRNGGGFSGVTSFRYRLERPEPSPRRVAPLVDFDDFAAFSDETLRRVFAAADAKVVMLALTGADETLIARIVRQLPPRAAAAFRARLKNPGAVRIRDIESAQQQLADLARQLVEQGVISLPDSRHFAAAA